MQRREAQYETSIARWQRFTICGELWIKACTNIPSPDGSRIPPPREKCEMNFRNNFTAFSWKCAARAGSRSHKAPMDFVADCLEGGRPFRMLTVIDQFTRRLAAQFYKAALRKNPRLVSVYVKDIALSLGSPGDYVWKWVKTYA